MEVTYASIPSPGSVNEDFVLAGPDFVVVLDGCHNCRRSPHRMCPFCFMASATTRHYPGPHPRHSPGIAFAGRVGDSHHAGCCSPFRHL